MQYQDYMTPIYLLEKIKPYILEELPIAGISKSHTEDKSCYMAGLLFGADSKDYIFVNVYEGPDEKERDIVYNKLEYFYEGLSLQQYITQAKKAMARLFLNYETKNLPPRNE